MTRLRYYRELLRVVGRPHILIALSTRLRALASTSSFRELDGIPLVNADDEPYGVPPSFTQFRSHSMDERLTVVTTRVRDGLLLLGLDVGIISVLAGQKFDVLAEWTSQRRGRRNVWFRLLLTPDDVGALAPDGTPGEARGQPQWYRVLCDVHVSASGAVFGIVAKGTPVERLGW
jgi:hypothetical protein